MEVLENPSIQDRPGPNGTLVVVGLDPVASVATFNDERATAAANAMPRSKYLAIIDTLGYAGVELEPGLPKLEYQFLCIGRGLPVEGYSAVPIYPAPVGSLGRTAVAPSSPLPWPDCYVHTLGGFDACISRVYKSSRDVVSISEDELDTVLKYSVYDQYRHGEEAAAAQAVTQTVREDAAPPSPSRTDRYDDEVNDFHASPSHSAHPHSLSSNVSSSGSGSGRTASPFQPRRMDLHVEMWLNLDAGHELSDPQLLTSELNQLESIEKDWAMRIAHEIVTKRPRTSAWIRGVDAAGDPETINASDSIASLGGVDNARPEEDDIVPEDAIEHRLYSADGQAAQGILPGRRKVTFAVYGKRAMKVLASRLFRPLRAFLKLREERNPPR